MEPKRISRDVAHAQGLKRFYTGEPCKHGHYAERFVANGGCVMCVNRSTPHGAKPVTARNLFWPRAGLVFDFGLNPTPEEMEAAINMVQAYGWLDDCVRRLRDGRANIAEFLAPPTSEDLAKVDAELRRLQGVKAAVEGRIVKPQGRPIEREEPEFEAGPTLRTSDAG